jgi:hypothetical protein
VTTPASEPLPSTPDARGGSVWEDMIDIFYAPTPTFERRRDGRFGIQLLVLTILTIVLYFATKPYLQPMYDAIWAQTAEGIRKGNPNVTDEQLSKMADMGDKFGVFSVAIGVPIMVLCIGVVIWLVGKLFDSQMAFRHAMVVATLSQFPKIIDSIVMGVQGFLMDPSKVNTMYSLKLSPARFMAADAPLLQQALLGRIDVFVIWCTILIAIGIHVLGRVEKSKAFIAAGIVWLLGAVPALYQALK